MGAYVYAFSVLFLLTLTTTGVQADDHAEPHLVEQQMWSCKDQSYKIAMKQVCDRTFDCYDQSDESVEMCGDVVSCDFRCKYSDQCLAHIQVCNFVAECGAGDKSDEENCQQLTSQCKNGETPCTDEPYICYGISDICDGYPICRDGSDEQDCSRALRSSISANTQAITTPSVATIVNKNDKPKLSKISKKLSRKAKKAAIKKFWRKGCPKSWKKCDRKSKKKLLKGGFKDCMKDPNSFVCAWRPVKKYSLRKCRKVSRKIKYRKPCQNFTALHKKQRKSH